MVCMYVLIQICRFHSSIQFHGQCSSFSPCTDDVELFRSSNATVMCCSHLQG